MMLLGGVLAVRSWRRGALREALPAAGAELRVQYKRIAIVLALILTYGLVLVGHPSLLVRLLVPGTLAGLPFWLASALFVATTILVLQRLSAEPKDRALTPWSIAKAVVIAVLAALAIQVVFQDLFLVRLP
jgi:hypothetical protein